MTWVAILITLGGAFWTDVPPEFQNEAECNSFAQRVVDNPTSGAVGGYCVTADKIPEGVQRL